MVMEAITVTRTVSDQGLSLCRCYCRHYTTLTGEGLHASGRLASTVATKDQDDD